MPAVLHLEHAAANILAVPLEKFFDVVAMYSHRLLKPGGVLLATVPMVSRMTTPDYWRFTRHSCSRLFGDICGSENIRVDTHGNVLASIAFLEGLAYQELRTRELDHNDEQYPLIVTVLATKREVAS